MVYGDGLKYMSMHFHLFQQCSVHESGRGSNPRSVITFCASRVHEWAGIGADGMLLLLLFVFCLFFCRSWLLSVDREARRKASWTWTEAVSQSHGNLDSVRHAPAGRRGLARRLFFQRLAVCLRRARGHGTKSGCRALVPVGH